MNKTLAALAAAATLALAGCSSSGDLKADAPESLNPFVTAVYDNTDFDAAPAETVTNAGNAVCEAWAGGLTLEDISRATAIGMTNSLGRPMTQKETVDAAYLIFAATNYLCPQYSDNI